MREPRFDNGTGSRTVARPGPARHQLAPPSPSAARAAISTLEKQLPHPFADADPHHPHAYLADSLTLSPTAPPLTLPFNSSGRPAQQAAPALLHNRQQHLMRPGLLKVSTSSRGAAQPVATDDALLPLSPSESLTCAVPTALATRALRLTVSLQSHSFPSPADVRLHTLSPSCSFPLPPAHHSFLHPVHSFSLPYSPQQLLLSAQAPLPAQA
ncbi:hypothetical protein V8E36_005519 [Tilletia maclaganii]